MAKTRAQRLSLIRAAAKKKVNARIRAEAKLGGLYTHVTFKGVRRKKKGSKAVYKDSQKDNNSSPGPGQNSQSDNQPPAGLTIDEGLDQDNIDDNDVG